MVLFTFDSILYLTPKSALLMNNYNLFNIFQIQLLQNKNKQQSGNLKAFKLTMFSLKNNLKNQVINLCKLVNLRVLYDAILYHNNVLNLILQFLTKFADRGQSTSFLDYQNLPYRTAILSAVQIYLKYPSIKISMSLQKFLVYYEHKQFFTAKNIKSTFQISTNYYIFKKQINLRNLTQKQTNLKIKSYKKQINKDYKRKNTKL
eukprot:TRINITY_DN19161_c0_g1_i14.p1 TRINITY_DN19161_c0_g1~~TRINITY_DN19161_c0_g1_i14.p1  ORF type:complete len:204 (-),score=-2.53 TRINITY_DN19161_c0_g1_i14:403-1014(-)